MPISFFMADKDSAARFERVANDVFDNAISSGSLDAFLSDERHHIALASEGDRVIGFVSAVDYFHPDKPRELWINEVGVAVAWQGRGIGKQLLALMLEHGRELGCVEAWVLTEPGNTQANALYRSLAGKRSEPTPVLLHSFTLVE